MCPAQAKANENADKSASNNLSSVGFFPLGVAIASVCQKMFYAKMVYGFCAVLWLAAISAFAAVTLISFYTAVEMKKRCDL